MPPYPPPYRGRSPYSTAFGSGAPTRRGDGFGFSSLAQDPSTQQGGQQQGGQGSGLSGIDQQVWEVINPQLQAAADAVNRRSQMGSQSISGLTSYLQQLASQYAPAISRVYGTEKKNAKATATYARGALTNAGTAKAADLNAALTQSGQTNTSGVDLAQQGKGAGAAAYGTGIAELDRLIANAAAAQTEAALEPSFASGMGSQNQSVLAAQLARQLADQQGQIEASVPQLRLDLQSQADAAARDTRNFNEQTREYNQSRADTLAAQAKAEKKRQAGIAGPNAPTNAGRKAYWDSVAAQRTHDTGVLWKGTTSGIAPVDGDPKRPGIQPAATLQGQAAQLAGIKTQAQINAEAARAQTARERARIAQQNANTSRQNANTSSSRAATSAAQAQTRENNRHAEATARNKVALQNASTAQQRAAVTRRAEAERERHNRASENIARAKAAAAAKKKKGGAGFDPSSGNYGH